MFLVFLKVFSFSDLLTPNSSAYYQLFPTNLTDVNNKQNNATFILIVQAQTRKTSTKMLMIIIIQRVLFEVVLRRFSNLSCMVSIFWLTRSAFLSMSPSFSVESATICPACFYFFNNYSVSSLTSWSPWSCSSFCFLRI